MNEAFDEVEKILKRRTWLETFEHIVMTLGVIGGIYWLGHIVLWSLDGFKVGLN